MSVSWKSDSFGKSIGNSSSRFSRSSESSFGSLARGKVGCLAPGYHVGRSQTAILSKLLSGFHGIASISNELFRPSRKAARDPLVSLFQDSRRTCSAKSRFQTPFTQRKPLIFSLVSPPLPQFYCRIHEWWGGKKKLVAVQEKGSKWFDLSRYDWHCFHTRNRPYIFAEDTTRSNGKINGNVNINSFSRPLQWAEIRRCLYSRLLTGDISKRYEEVVSASVFEKFDSARNIFYNATVCTFAEIFRFGTHSISVKRAKSNISFS